MIWTWSITVLGKKLLFYFQSMTVPETRTKGMSARIPHTTYFVQFADYDNTTDDRLNDEILFLQERFKLGDYMVFETSDKGRHTICLDELTPAGAWKVMHSTSGDYLFTQGFKINEYRTWILRFDRKGERPKPTYLRTIESPYNGERMQSQAHATFLQAFYGVKVRLANPDGNDELEIQEYKTSSKVTVKDLIKELKKGTK